VNTYFARHTYILDVDDATRAHLWNNGLVAIHFPDHLTGGIRDQDNESLDPQDYPPNKARAVRALVRLANEGGYVCAQHEGHDEHLLGRVAPGTQIYLLRGGWGRANGLEGRQAVLKAVKMTDVQMVDPRRHPHLAQAFANRPRRGTLQRWWQDGGEVRSLVEQERGRVGTTASGVHST